ncbi:MAG: hypothetical protein ABSA21_03075 [Candidatus Limnocylindrales bacterium]|jgi:hypothetical protein
MDEFDRGDPRDPRRAGSPSPADLAGLAGMLGIPQQRRDARDPRGPLGLGGRDSRDVREASGRDMAAHDGPAPRMEVVEYAGQARPTGPNTTLEDARLALDDSGLTLEAGGGRPIRAAYRDLSLIAIQQSTALIVLGDGPDAMRWMLEKFGDKLGPVVRELRERRLKQRLTDGLVKVPDEPAELLEFEWKPTTAPLGPGPDGPPIPATGVGQFVIHPWGFVVCPVDERATWIHYRRAAIAKVTVTSPGEVVVDGAPGTLTLRGLGAASTRLHDTLQKLRDGAFDDAAAFVEQLLPDAPFGLRQKADELLVDGRPTRPQEFGDSGWPLVETAVLGEPTFADSYQSLCATAGDAAPRWAAMSPQDPGGQEPKIWFLIAMPGNLVALELVTAGAHATYFYRVMPRAQYGGEPPEKLGIAAEQAVRDISEALVDCRFLREPMALPADQLRLPKYLRYRLALAVLPSLAWARARFVARIVHRDPASWSAAVADLIRWHGSAKDEAAEWPGRAAQEAQIAAAGGDGAEDGDSESGPDAAPDEGSADEVAPGTATPGPAAVAKLKPSGTAG